MQKASYPEGTVFCKTVIYLVAKLSRLENLIEKKAIELKRRTFDDEEGRTYVKG